MGAGCTTGTTCMRLRGQMHVSRLLFYHAVLHASMTTSSAYQSQPPNIMLLMCDSFDGALLDSPLVSLPTLTALAADGVSFKRMYASSPQCVPSRTSMLAGRRTDQIRAFSNGRGLAMDPSGRLDEKCVELYDAQTCASFGAEQRVNSTFFDALSAHMEVAVFGKVDVGQNVLTRYGPSPTEAGFHGGPTLPILTRAADIRKPTKPDPMSITNDNIANVHPEDWSMHTQCIDWLRAKGASIAAADFPTTTDATAAPATATAAAAAATASNTSSMSAEFVATEPAMSTSSASSAPGALPSVSTRASTAPALAPSASRPWFLYCSLNIPHPPFHTNLTWLRAVDEARVRETPPEWVPLARMHPHDAYMSVSKGVTESLGDYDVFKVRRTYYAMAAEADYLIGQVVDAAKEAGLYDSTLVVFLSDHGEMAMSHSQVWKNAMYEPSLRVPFIVSGGRMAARALPRGSAVHAVTSLLDLFPSLLWMARLPQTQHALAGSSLAPFLGGGGDMNSRKDYAVSQYHSNLGNTGTFCIVWRKYKYIAFGHGFRRIYGDGGYVPQLFDLEVDPGEMHNLASERPDLALYLDVKLRRELASGFNALSSSGDYHEIDVAVKRSQQALYRRFYLDGARLDLQVERLRRCDELKKSLALNGVSLLALDPEAELPCAANDDAPTRQRLSREETKPEPTRQHAQPHQRSPVDPELHAVIDPMDSGAAQQSEPSRSAAAVQHVPPLEEEVQAKLWRLFSRAYTGFDEMDWLKIAAWEQDVP